MKFSNTHNIPGPLAAALRNDDYDLQGCPENIISVTSLIAPPKQKTLEMRHDGDIEVDVSDRFWMVLGTACHYVIEKATSKQYLAESRWFFDTSTKEFFVTTGETVDQCEWYKKDHFYVTGRIDVYSPEEKKLSDYKITSVWSWLMEKKMKPEHEAQLQINGLAMTKLGHETKSLSILMLFRDWSKTKSKADYPDLPIPFKEIIAETWKEDVVYEYIGKRLKLHIEARAIEDDKIPDCSPDERWARPTKYAVMKPGRKTAVKLFDLRPSADQMREYPGCTVVERPGLDVRCMDYCNSKPWCSYYKNVYGVTVEPVEEY